eukprot:CAMPEP_0205929824 /NCGR_PEP_ID=MMETSP1325-20131115/25532_1 /ASSEMBLY_ACC=CAM_ASM_000708 /TAXON_ID=236786 /ORGANISM="Florenciella sp., Strain RCC1007" /LENGTH=62 /DNA_ID=CAMNT_0053299097 /DNA_START=26 /DNA_END=214 /DNA_ORIENTATION=-
MPGGSAPRGAWKGLRYSEDATASKSGSRNTFSCSSASLSSDWLLVTAKKSSCSFIFASTSSS